MRRRRRRGVAARRRAVPAHRVWERHPEQPVVAPDEADQRRGEVVAGVRRQLAESRGAPARQDQRLERPDRPERDDDEPRVRGFDDARAAGLEPGHVLEERPAGRGEVRPLGRVLAGCFRRDRPDRPDLAVGMGVRSAHRLATVLEDLDPGPVLAQFVGLVGPDVDDPPDLVTTHPAEVEVVPRRVAHDPARPPLALRAEQAVAAVPPFVGRRRPQRGEVVREDERALVRRVPLTAGAGVAGAEIALGVVGGRRVRAGAGSRSRSPRQGRPARPGETSTQSPRSGSQRRCGSRKSGTSSVSLGASSFESCTAERVRERRILRWPTTSDPRRLAASGMGVDSRAKDGQTEWSSGRCRRRF